jgi:hypothetical protein
MRDTRTAEEKNRDRKVGQRAEEVASWYFRLNGFLLLPGFVVHIDQFKATFGRDGEPRYQRTEADLLGVRFVESKEIIFAFDGKKVMKDDQRLTSICSNSTTKQALFILVEVKTGLCEMNGPWTKIRDENMQRVIRRLGFAVDDVQVQKIADHMYRCGKYEDDYYVLQYICIGSEKSLEISERFTSVLQINWFEIGQFLIERFLSFPEKTPDGHVHDQWPDFGKKFGKWITAKQKTGNLADINPAVIKRFIKTGDL